MFKEKKLNLSNFERNIVTILILIVCSIHLYLVLTSGFISSENSQIKTVSSYFYICLFLVVFMVLLSLFLVKNLYEELNENRQKYLYWFSFGIVICSVCIRMPIFSWQSEPYWETSTNFIWQTYERSFFDGLMLDDSGYLALFPRIVALIVIKIFGQIQMAPILLQMFLVILFAYVITKILRPEFEKYLSIEVKLIIVLFLGTSTFFASDLFAFHNIAYWGGMLLSIAFISDMNKMSKLWYIVECVIVFLACCSKPQNCIFVPVFLLFTIFNRKSIERRKIMYILIAFIGCAFSAIYYFLGMGEAARLGSFQGSYVLLTINSLYETLQGFLSYFISYRAEGYYAGLIINVLMLISIVIIGIYFAKRNKKSLFLCLTYGVIAVGIIALPKMGYGLPYDFKATLDRFNLATGAYCERNSVLMLTTILMILIIILNENSIFNKKTFKTVGMVFFTILTLRFSFQFQTINAATTVQSNWDKFSVALKNESYGIPVSTGNGGFILKNSKAYYYGNKDLWTYDGHFSSGVSKINTIEEPINKLYIDVDKPILSVYATKEYLDKTENIVMNIYDKNGNILQPVRAIAEYDRISVGFILDEPCENAAFIEFVNSDNNLPYYFDSNVFVVFEFEGEGLSGDANWGQYSIEETL